jgi:Fe-coproporphyrin III synthase
LSVYSDTKVFRYPEHLAAVAAGEVRAPVHIRIKPTNVCNHDCYFCAYRSQDMSLGEDMDKRDRIPREKMLEVADDLVAMGVEAVTFSGGGEPLIYPYLVETIERLAAGGIRIAALSNGSQLKAKVADAFADHGTWIRISIDGWDGPSYAKYRSVPETEFAKVMDNISGFAKRGSDCVLGASLIVDKTNAGKIAYLSGQLKDAGASHVKVSGCVVSNDGAENNAYHAKITDVVREQIADAQMLGDDNFAVVDHYHSLAERFDKPYTTCPFVNFLTVIAADSIVYTCQDKAYTKGGVLGSIADQSFREMWFSDANKAALHAVNPSSDCQHHCIAENKNRMLLDFLRTDRDHAAFV